MHEQTNTTPPPPAIPPHVMQTPADAPTPASLIETATQNAQTIAAFASRVENVEDISIGDVDALGRRCNEILKALAALKTQLAV